MISVVIPAYNVERYISACLDSVLSQEGVDTEIIVVDDESTDSTLSIIKSYATQHNRITVISQKHAGPSTSRNNALLHCHGQWIAMVDGDDVIAPGALKHMLDIATTHQSVDIVFGKWKYFETEFISSAKHHSEPMLISGTDAVETMLYQKKRTNAINPSACCKLFRSSLWNNFKFKEGIIYEDLHLIPQLCAPIKEIAVTDFIVYGYRHNNNSILHTFSEKRMDALKVTSELCSIFSNNNKLYKAAISRHFSAAFNMRLLITANKADMPQHSAECKKIIRRLAPSQLFARNVRLKNRIGAILQYLPFIFNSSCICKKLLKK